MTDTEPTASAESRNESERVKALRTFETDVAEALQSEKTSVAHIVSAESERSREEHTQTMLVGESTHPNRARVLVMVSGILVLTALLILVGFWLIKPANPPAVAVPGSSAQGAALGGQKTIDLTNLPHKQVLEAIEKERDSATLRVNTIESLTFVEGMQETKEALGSSEFLRTVAPSTPASLSRALKEPFIFGLISFDGNQPFIVFNTASFQDAYDGMLRGEVDMYREVGNIFVNTKDSLPGLSTSTSAYFGTDPQVQTFRDMVIQNIDARVVKNDLGQIVFLYAFPNQTTLILTTNPKTFTEVMKKLIRARLIQ